jgi:sigma-B regulation protein RsbU (phosphoserine phosphatase)
METSAAKPQLRAGGSMATAEQAYFRPQLEQRRERLLSALHSSDDASLSGLLSEVDAALARMDEGTFGICETCHDSVEKERLLSDPLIRFCLDHLTHEEQRALECDLELAARIQKGLLPPPEMSAAGWQVRYHYEPLGPVSGDYCDVLESDNGLLFLFGDVSGKGVAASMLMSHLHATFRSLARANLPLQRMVEAANRVFSESTLAGQYATLVVGRATTDGSVEFVSAGHLPVLHLGRDGAKSEGATGVPLGMFTNSHFPVHRLSLSSGEALLIYTDGFTESCNPVSEEYGVKRVRETAQRHYAATPERLIAACLADLQDFAAGTKREDDLSLLVLRRAA